MRKVAYLTDVEGRWDKLAAFCRGCPSVAFDESEGLRVAEDTVFVFGGDAIDRGPSSRRIVRELLRAKLRQPERVVLLAGNRDINKMRLVRELTGHVPARVASRCEGLSRPDLLKFIFERTMGAGVAFENRRAELVEEGRASEPESVVQSFLDDLEPGAPLTAYLSVLQLAHREGDTLFVHGGVTAENLRFVPRRRERVATVDAWVEGLNAFYAESLDAFRERRLGPDGTPEWADLVAYQAPIPGTRFHQASVVYARPSTTEGEPLLPPCEVVRELLDAGIARVVVGHTPSGDFPAVLRDGEFELVLADNSYGRIETGSVLTFADGPLRIQGETKLDSGERVAIAHELARGDGSPVGLVEAATGRLVKAPLGDGYLLYKAVGERKVTQVRVPRETIAGGALRAAR